MLVLFLPFRPRRAPLILDITGQIEAELGSISWHARPPPGNVGFRRHPLNPSPLQQRPPTTVPAGAHTLGGTRTATGERERESSSLARPGKATPNLKCSCERASLRNPYAEDESGARPSHFPARSSFPASSPSRPPPPRLSHPALRIKLLSSPLRYFELPTYFGRAT